MPRLTLQSFSQARFITSAVKAEGYPAERGEGRNLLPEIAIAGRSNVGKSSLLNLVFQKKGLVKTSSTPGKTQLLNFFVAGDSLSFVDLPGYGFAAVPPSVRKKWGPMVQEYLQNRESLELILFLFDIRRKPNADDRQLLEWICYHERAMLLVLTKVDKVSQSERKKRAQEIVTAFGDSSMKPLYFSAPKRVGRRELIAAVLAHLNPGKEPDEA